MSSRAGGGCPDALELTRAVALGGDPSLLAHLAGCGPCRASWRDQQEIISLGRQLPTESISGERVRVVRGAVLAAARLDRSASPRRRTTLVAAAALAVAAVLALVVGGLFRSQPIPPPQVAVTGAPAATTAPAVRARPPAHIQAGTGTRFTVLAGPPHEKVELQEGSLRVSVEPATAGETFRIVTRRGEVEVRGTIFETVATAAGLVSVRVERGRVVVRPGGTEEVILGAGGQWQASSQPTRPRAASGRRNHPVRAPHLPPDLAPVIAARPASGSWGADSFVPGPPAVARAAEAARARPSSAIDPAEKAFGEGLSLLQRPDPAAAARAFERALALEPSAVLVEDVWYWRAVALARAAAGAQAREALGAFIARFPLSARAGEVSVILGRLLLEVGDRSGAEARFRAGIHDCSTRVRAAAQAGLEALARPPGASDSR